MVRWACDNAAVPDLAATVPSPTTDDDGTPLAEHQIAQWRTHGAVVVDGLVPIDLVLRTRSAALDVLRPPVGDEIGDFGSAGAFVFPSEVESFNEATLHSRLLAAVAQLLGCTVREIRLTQSDLWAKHGRSTPLDDAFDNDDQRMHVDYPNHTLTHPPRWETPDAVEVIVYADDVTVTGGATSVVLRSGPDDPAYAWPIVATPGVGALEWVNSKGHAEAYLAEVAPEVAAWRAEHLYAREQSVEARCGSVLLYRHDTWHRGTPVRPGHTRVAHNLTFRRAGAEWVSTLHEGWAWAMYRRSRVMERLVATSTVDQRCVLGFPAPGHPWWTPDTVDAVEARYAPLGFDASEYRAALS